MDKIITAFISSLLLLTTVKVQYLKGLSYFWMGESQFALPFYLRLMIITYIRPHAMDPSSMEQNVEKWPTLINYERTGFGASEQKNGIPFHFYRLKRLVGVESQPAIVLSCSLFNFFLALFFALLSPKTGRKLDI
jgi:hypothetical protein